MFLWRRTWRGLSQDSTRHLMKNINSVTGRWEESEWREWQKGQVNISQWTSANGRPKMPIGEKFRHSPYPSFLLSVGTCRGVDGIPHLTAAMVPVRAHPSLSIHSSANTPLMHGRTQTPAWITAGVPIMYAHVLLLLLLVSGHLFQWQSHLKGDDILASWANEMLPKPHTVTYW